METYREDTLTRNESSRCRRDNDKKGAVKRNVMVQEIAQLATILADNSRLYARKGQWTESLSMTRGSLLFILWG